MKKDELRTHIKHKTNEYWVIYALDVESKKVVDFRVGKRTKKNIKTVTDTLLMSQAVKIYTDGLDIYKYLIPEHIHIVR